MNVGSIMFPQLQHTTYGKQPLVKYKRQDKFPFRKTLQWKIKLNTNITVESLSLIELIKVILSHKKKEIYTPWRPIPQVRAVIFIYLSFLDAMVISLNWTGRYLIIHHVTNQTTFSKYWSKNIMIYLLQSFRSIHKSPVWYILEDTSSSEMIVLFHPGRLLHVTEHELKTGSSMKYNLSFDISL